jgi:hypothetical protein
MIYKFAKCSIVFLLFSIGIKGQTSDQFRYIDNGHVRLGIDLSGGGSVFFFAESKTRRNMLNHCDKGRFIQQSYYGDKDSSYWAKQPWCWNPVQGGGYLGEPAKVLESNIRPGSLYVKSRPKHWATGKDIDSATMEEKITLKGNMAHIRYRFSYTGKHSHRNSDQELPAVFVDYGLPNLVFYQGSNPWKNETTTSVVPGWPNEAHESDECWAAYTDDSGWGIGVYTPGTTRLTSYRFVGGGKPGPESSACSYFAPLGQFSITSGFVYEYDVYLTIGNINEIRTLFYDIHSK